MRKYHDDPFQHQLTDAVRDVARAIHKLDTHQARENFAVNLRDLSHLIFGGSFLTQIFSNFFNELIAVLGVSVLAFLYGLAHLISKGGEAK